MTLTFTSKQQRRQVLSNLRRGLRTLMTKGWCQGTYSQREADGTRTYCAVGSMRDTIKSGSRYSWFASGGYDTCSALEAGIKHVMPRVKTEYDALNTCTAWNDRRGRTAGQVKRAFRAAIKATEQAEVL